MSKIYLLDCTLRDGGYVNNWTFGKDAIDAVRLSLEAAGIDIIELGFFREEPSSPERTVYGFGHDAATVLTTKKKNVFYSMMIEGGEPEQTFPVHRLGTPEESNVDYIRICIWKRLMREHMTYCRSVIEQGYRVSVQPTQVGQYTDAEFIDMCHRANDINPFAVYIVDTWGTQSVNQIRHFLELADRWLYPNIRIGYHGHNNKMQALSCAQTAIQMGLSHELCLDSSIMGMGRGIGNLQTEIIMDFLNENCSSNYKYKPKLLINLFHRYLQKFYDAAPWGYSLYHYLSAEYECSPDFASYFKRNNLGEDDFILFLDSLRPEEKIVFRREFVEKRLKELKLTAN